MTIECVAILGSGDMGSAVAASLIANGKRVVTCLDGRSERSRALAARAGMEDAGSAAAMLASADLLLSIVPPASAAGFAAQVCPLVAASGRDILFVDANAIAPQTVAGIAAIAAGNGVRFQDVGIVGAAPRPGRMPVRFYTSGPCNDEMQDLATDLVEIWPLGSVTGTASAMKMVYASLTKGTHALRAAALLAARKLGVDDAIHAEWQRSLPDVYKAMEGRMPILACDSGRWAGEMREIAETYESVGLPRGFHEGAQAMYELLAQTGLAAESRDEAREKARSIESVVDELAAVLTAPRR